MAHATQWKIDRVEELTNAMVSSPVVGIVNIHGIPAKQLSKMRARLRGHVGLLVTKRTLIDMALDKAAETRPGIEGLKEASEGQVGLVFTEENPFKLYKMMERTKTASPAKGGEEAPNDIVIKAGDTSFKPGPVIREFQQVGIPAAIERGKVVIKKDAVLVKAGEPIPKDLAAVLPRLDILPLMLGLDLQAAFEDGMLYEPEVLDVDTDALLGQFASGAAAAFNLAVNAKVFNEVTIGPLLTKGHTYGFNLAIEAGIMTPETVEPILARAHGRMLALASQIPDALDDDLKEALGSAAAAAPAPSEAPADEATKPDEEEDKKDEEEKEKVSEEDAAAGLSALFG
jgi:large subunit ribosomal protein L10